MAFTAAEEARIAAIEDSIEKLLVMIGNLASKSQLEKYININQAEVSTLSDTVDSLQSQITVIQGNLP